MARPRVLVVDDDAAIRRFVALALEDLDITLQCVGSVPEGLALLAAEGPAALVMTDLMMPGASGTDLLHALAATPALRGSARLVVFSAGLDAVDAQRLQELGVWRRLSKPVALADLLNCVMDALDTASAARHTAQEQGAQGDGYGGDAPAARGATGDVAGDAAEPSAAGAGVLLPADQLAAMAQHFGGDLALFLAYHDACVHEFAQDAVQGDHAAAAADAEALRRVAHNLKSVLATLGYGALSAAARTLEDACAMGNWPAAQTVWEGLRALLPGIAPLKAETAEPVELPRKNV